eukprot:gene8535-359_t
MKRNRNDFYGSNKRQYYSNQYSSEDSFGCERCGRESHDAQNCFAKIHINGYEIFSEDEETESDELFCTRCGRDSYESQNCFAKFGVDGKPLQAQQTCHICDKIIVYFTWVTLKLIIM